MRNSFTLLLGKVLGKMFALNYGLVSKTVRGCANGSVVWETIGQGSS